LIDSMVNVTKPHIPKPSLDTLPNPSSGFI
jgi:hypothetical protein